MLDNKIFKSSIQESLKAYGLSELNHSLHAAFMGARSNNLTVHHLTTEFEMERDDLSFWIDSCNIDEQGFKKLEESKIYY